MLIASLVPQYLVGVSPKIVQVDGAKDTVSLKGAPARLSSLEIRLRMRNLPDWTTDGESLFYTRTFEGFVEAVSFVNSLVEPAEQLGHHPDIKINYNQVSLQLTTHDALGITELDFQLASKISQLTR
ncbi:4a-hydroxytetrahydrobiopterin dehydratase [Leptothoe spongobia TAU-MAC 1115]|uniref:Putative pterin-4-alpha-carbinolamine dehydratase n=2 Tax=Leptothoe TaxID=2651725 RepID=A0A947GM50_9CYAN|nr:4a-hydroxytetrahydrobiopterin dehydratase [Leptothoe spongobia TAU-MAC 1115]